MRKLIWKIKPGREEKDKVRGEEYVKKMKKKFGEDIVIERKTDKIIIQIED